MITYVKEPLLFADYEKGITKAIVIPVNCVGVMGAGVAKEAKKRWPTLAAQWYKEYEDGICCHELKKEPGKTYEYGTKIFATTKNDWRNPSEMKWVKSILSALTMWPDNYVIGVPALGCGLGGLPWNDVKALYEKYLAESPINFICYEP